MIAGGHGHAVDAAIATVAKHKQGVGWADAWNVAKGAVRSPGAQIPKALAREPSPRLPSYAWSGVPVSMRS